MSNEPEHVNPFAAPLESDSPGDILGTSDLSEAEAIRKELLNREASIKGVGSLYLLGAVFLTIGVISLIFASINAPNAGVGGPEIAVVGVLVVMAGLGWFLGLGLRKLRPSVRPWAIAVMVIYVLLSLASVNPIGLLINGYFLWLVASEKGKRVLSPEYQEIIAATPHIKYKTSIVVWILLILLIVLVVFGFAAVLVNA